MKKNTLKINVYRSHFYVAIKCTCNPLSYEWKINFSKYHPGKYLVAWHPKSSELNERTTIVVENEQFGEVLYRQIAELWLAELSTMPKWATALCKEKMLDSLNLALG